MCDDSNFPTKTELGVCVRTGEIPQDHGNSLNFLKMLASHGGYRHCRSTI